jgi:orotate phosphoribosyltransferase
MPAARGRQSRSRDKRPTSVKAEREELLELLLREGVLLEPPAPASEGAASPWRLDSPGVTLTARGAELAGRGLLRLLQPFEARQLVASSPRGALLLQACVMLSRGKYRGLIVQPSGAADGAAPILEGRVDPTEPMVLIDDAVGDGADQEAVIGHLARVGLWVEGGVCLVRFGYESGVSRLRARGYPVAALYDSHELSARMPGAAPQVLNPGKALPKQVYASGKVPDGLQPAELARRVIAEALHTGKLLRPPRRVAGKYTAAGGVWVSVRPKDGAHPSHAEDGFWNFPGEKALPLPAALTQAAFLAARQLAQAASEPLAALEQGAVTVTFCSALQECQVGQLDPERYGIVVRSRERTNLVGGAFPRLPGIANEWQQLEYARTQNARLLPDEPFALYRYKVQEAVEPGAPAPTQQVPRAEAAPAGAPPPKNLAEGVARLTPPLCKFLLRHLGATARYEPLTDTTDVGLDTARLAHQAWTLARAFQKLGPAPLADGARTLLTALTSDLVFDEAEHVWIRADEGPSISQVSFALLALLEMGEDLTTAKALASTLWSRIGPQGRFSCLLNDTADDEACQDSMPGQALLALARAAEAKVHPVDEKKLARAWRFYHHRFRHRRHWDQVLWLTQAAAAWWRVDRDAGPARLAFELCDWALAHQSEKTGAFLTGQQPDTPGATTALYLEALGAAAGLAAGLRERPRHKRYLDASARAVAFLDSLVLQDRDVAQLPNARQALGGVRMSHERNEVHVDFVQHTLCALLALRK